MHFSFKNPFCHIISYFKSACVEIKLKKSGLGSQRDAGVLEIGITEGFQSGLIQHCWNTFGTQSYMGGKNVNVNWAKIYAQKEQLRYRLSDIVSCKLED